MYPPSAVVTVTVALPSATAVTKPAASIVAIEIAFDAQVTFLFVAFAGLTFSAKSEVVPSPNVNDTGAIETPVTTTGLTVTAQVAVCEPSVVVTVMVALPTTTAVTKPLASTVATEVLLDDQDTLLSVAFAGSTVSVKSEVAPSTNTKEVGATETLVTTIGFTVMAHSPVCPPSVVVTVTVALPSATAVTKPLASTNAIEVLLDTQVTLLSAASAGSTVSVKSEAAPSSSAKEAGAIETLATGTGLTVTAHSSVWPPSVVVTVTVALPSATAVTKPSASTVAIEVLLDAQVTLLIEAPAGSTVSDKSEVAPGSNTKVAGVTETLVTAVAALTVTAQSAVYEPSVVVTVTVALPSATAVTKPLASIVAIEVLFDNQVTLLSVASTGSTVSVKSEVVPASNVKEIGATETPVTVTNSASKISSSRVGFGVPSAVIKFQ